MESISILYEDDYQYDIFINRTETGGHTGFACVEMVPLSFGKDSFESQTCTGLVRLALNNSPWSGTEKMMICRFMNLKKE